MLDEQTNLKFTKLFSTRSVIIDTTLEQLEKWKKNGLVVKNIWLYNAAENKKPQEPAETKDWKMSIFFKYTAQNTPQQNYLA